MEVEINPSNYNSRANPEQIDEMLEYLVHNKDIQFKSQQRDEGELSNDEKRGIAVELFNRSQFNFLSRFGKYLNCEQLNIFKIDADEEMLILLENLLRLQSKDVRKREQRNRRYEALKKLIDGKTYFSDSEMMKRNPLLYDQLVGQYLSEEERRSRDRADNTATTFVNILMEGIERDNARSIQQQQKEAEDNAMEEEDSDEDEEILDCEDRNDLNAQASSSKWGECPGMQDMRINKDEFYAKRNNSLITATERELLREEFVTFMHQSFLDGLDEDFDYTTVDDNEDYDNLDIVTHDAEERYFDSEEPDDGVTNQQDESSEDELDIYMNALNQHPAVCALSQEMKKL